MNALSEAKIREIRKCAIFDHIITQLKKKSTRDVFLNGLNGNVQITEKELQILDSL